MKNIIDSIKNYFSKKERGDNTELAPIGMCPVCWGHSEWDGEFYKLNKDKHLVPGKDIYENFISKIVDKHISTTHKHKNEYICTTCNKNI